MGKEDTGWAWVCLTASFLTMFIIAFLDYSAGTLQLALLEVYHDDVAKTSVITMACVGSMLCAAPLASFVVSSTSCRTCCVIGGILSFTGMVSSAFIHNLDALFVTFGIISGIGKSFALIASFVSVGYNFNRRRSVASGIFLTGAGLGIFSGSPIVRFLLDFYGLDGTFLMLSAISLHISLFGMLHRPTKFETGAHIIQNGEGHHRKSDTGSHLYQVKRQLLNNMKLLKNPGFLALGGSTFSWNFALAAITIHIQTFSHSTGVTKDNAATLMTAVGIGNILSRLLVGCSTSASGLDGMTVYMGQCAVIGVVTVLFPLFAMTYTGQFVYCLLHGLYTGGLSSQIIPLTTETVDVQFLSPAVGMLHLIMGVAWLMGPYITGFVLDSGGTYAHCFILSGGCFLMAVFFIVLTVLLKRDASVSNVVHEIELEKVPLSHNNINSE